MSKFTISPSNIPKKLRTFGNSMYPLLHNEDVVIIQKIMFTKVRTNDVVCIKKNNKLLTHRVVYRTDKYIITKGDNNRMSDGKSFKKNLVGIVNKIMRNNTEIDINSLYLIQSSIYLREINQLKNVLDNKKVDFVFLKGLPVYLYLTKTHPKKFYGDCDILIRKNGLKKTKQIFKKLGYTQTPSPKFTSNSEINFSKINNGIPIHFDIHLEPVFVLTTGGNIDLIYSQKNIEKLGNMLIDERIQKVVNAESYPFLSNENQFIYLSLHLFHHSLKSASRFELIDCLLKKNFDRMNFSEVEDKILSYNLQNFIYPACILLIKYYKSPFPKTFLKKIEPNRNAMKFISGNIASNNIFDDEKITFTRRMNELISLSPEKSYKKLFILFNLRFLYMIGLIICKRIIFNYGKLTS